MCNAPQMGCARRIAHIRKWCEQATIVIFLGDLYFCSLPQCEALHACCSSYLITTKQCYDQDVKVMADAIFITRIFPQCISL